MQDNKRKGKLKDMVQEANSKQAAHHKAEEILKIIRDKQPNTSVKTWVDAVNRDCTLADMHDELESVARKLQELANKLIRLQ